MIKSILCALDMSQTQPDDEILKAAAALARQHGAKLDVVSVVPDLGYGEVSSFFPEDYQERAVKQAVATLKSHVREALADEAETLVRHELVAVGKVYEQVLRVADEVGADLIVVGAHQPGLSDYLIGSNAAKIVQHAKCSVYVVRL